MIPVNIRPYLPEDGPGVIDTVMTSYNTLGYTMDFSEFDSDLASIPSVYQDSGGEFWVFRFIRGKRGGELRAHCLRIAGDGIDKR